MRAEVSPNDVVRVFVGLTECRTDGIFQVRAEPGIAREGGVHG
jgi:hypothetical protein